MMMTSDTERSTNKHSGIGSAKNSPPTEAGYSRNEVRLILLKVPGSLLDDLGTHVCSENEERGIYF